MTRHRKRLSQYAALLRVRKHLENIEAEKHGAARRRVFNAEQERDEIVARQRAALNAATAATQFAVDVYRAHQYLRYERYLSSLAVEKDAQIRSLEALAEEQRQVLEGAIKQRRMMEKLLQKSQRAFHEETLALDQKRIDEAAAVQAAQRKINTPRAI